MKQLSHFLMDIDRQWQPLESQRQVLAIIGSGALMLQSDYERGTKDGDVLQTAGLSDAVKARLLEMAGKGTSLHRRHRCTSISSLPVCRSYPVGRFGIRS